MNAPTCFSLNWIDGHIAHLVLNRPEAMNTMHPTFWRELDQIVTQLHRDGKARALVITLIEARGIISREDALLRVEPRGVAAPKWVIVDGSNVMHWKDDTPQIETLREVLDRLAALGFSPGVVFDANAGHLLAGRYLHHAAFAELLGLAEDRVMVVNKGTPADAQARAIEEIRRACQTDDAKAVWANQGAEFPNLTTTQFDAFIKKELAKWSQVVKASGAKLD